MLNVSPPLVELMFNQVKKKSTETFAETYIVLLMLARLVLTYLDIVDGSIFVKHKMKMHVKGWMQETEKLRDDMDDIWKTNNGKDIYRAMEGQRLALNWVAHLTIDELILIADRGSLKFAEEEAK